MGEALVVIGAKASEHGVGQRQGSGAGEAQFADQAVLAGAPGALDAALGLKGVSGNLLDAELLRGLSQLSGRLFASELFGEGPVGVVALKDGAAIVVEAEANAVGSDHGVHTAQLADGIFRFELEVSGQHVAGGVVLKTDRCACGVAAFEPIVAAGIGESHHAETRAGRAPGAILTGPAFLRRGQFGGA